jgi:hypothetical protein
MILDTDQYRSAVKKNVNNDKKKYVAETVGSEGEAMQNGPKT